MNVAPTPHPIRGSDCLKCLGLGQRWIQAGLRKWEWYRCSGCRGTGRKVRP